MLAVGEVVLRFDATALVHHTKVQTGCQRRRDDLVCVNMVGCHVRGKPTLQLIGDGQGGNVLAIETATAAHNIDCEGAAA
ncbi:hypothetical protein D3C72_2167500 [compost metagenome]